MQTLIWNTDTRTVSFSTLSRVPAQVVSVRGDASTETINVIVVKGTPAAPYQPDAGLNLGIVIRPPANLKQGCLAGPSLLARGAAATDGYTGATSTDTTLTRELMHVESDDTSAEVPGFTATAVLYLVPAAGGDAIESLPFTWTISANYYRPLQPAADVIETYPAAALVAGAVSTTAALATDVRAFGAATTNTAAANKTAIQAAIDAVAITGGTVLLTEMYPCAPGLILKKGVTLQGNQFAPKGTPPADGTAAGPGKLPKGGGLIITDTSTTAFLSMDTATRCSMLMFYYPNQPITTATPTTSLINYARTIQNVDGARGITVERCVFPGATQPMVFDVGNSEDYFIDNCYGYPIAKGFASFLFFNNVTDIPRVTNCHVNPGVCAQLTGFPSSTVADYMASSHTSYGFGFVNTQSFVCAHCFVFALGVGFYSQDAYGDYIGCSNDTVPIPYLVGGTDGYGYVQIFGGTNIVGGGTGGANGYNACISNFGLVRAFGVQARLGNNTYIPSSAATPTAYFAVSHNGVVELNGCGTLADAGFSWYADTYSPGGEMYQSACNFVISGYGANGDLNVTGVLSVAGASTWDNGQSGTDGGGGAYFGGTLYTNGFVLGSSSYFEADNFQFNPDGSGNFSSMSWDANGNLIVHSLACAGDTSFEGGLITTSSNGNMSMHGLNVGSDGIASAGNIVTPAQFYLSGATNPFINWGGSAGLTRTGAAILTAGNGAAGDGSGMFDARSFRSKAVTFANRVASPVTGTFQTFSDSTTNTWGATITGGGSTTVLGYYNGTNWTVFAK